LNTRPREIRAGTERKYCARQEGNGSRSGKSGDTVCRGLELHPREKRGEKGYRAETPMKRARKDWDVVGDKARSLGENVEQRFRFTG